jgi:mono/diheme cytochrome c family protein
VTKARVGWLAATLVMVVSSQVVRPSGTAAAAASSQSTAAATPPQAAVLDRYCMSCHGARLKTAGLSLESLDLHNVARDAAVWEKVARKLRSGAMPPAGLPRPDERDSLALASWLETSLDHAAEIQPNPGRKPALHRLNRSEYANAVRDLLAIDLQAIGAHLLLPADDTGYGFDNIADVLSVSPLLLERYLSAARKISSYAIGDPSLRPVSQLYGVHKQLRQDDRMGEDLPFDSRGGFAVSHYFPVDGEYVIKLHMLRTYEGKIRGLNSANELELRLNRTLIRRFTIGGSTAPTPAMAARQGASAPTAPTPANGQTQAAPSPRARAAGPEATQYLMGADADLEFRVSAKAGPASIGVSYARKPAAPEGMLLPVYPVTSYEYAGDVSVSAGVEQIEIRGPYDVQGVGETPSRQRIFVCQPRQEEEASCARQILSGLARRAYRRPLTEDDVRPLLDLYKTARQNGDFAAGIQVALQRILASPDFLFRIEYDPPGTTPATPYRVSDLDLASRLSFFLWSSVPDEPLLNAAIQGKLKDPAILEQQTRRMLADPRAAALVSNFAGQWLQLRNVRFSTPDPYAFPDFDENLRESMLRETELFFESQLRDDRSVVDLLTADYTFLNERLARHYHVENVYGSHFRRVKVTDPARQGLLGQAAILMVTSYPNRTAPTIRGKWLLENILGTPPPPPPPNVPALKDLEADVKPMAMRARMEQHRANPVCASCHARMDPLGFALENFDAVGAWRVTEGDDHIDASGALPDGTTFLGAAGLRSVLLAHREEFVSTVTEKLLTYALGRGAEYYDQPTIRRIVRDAARSGDHWSALVLGIVDSVPFKMRLPAPAAVPTAVNQAHGVAETKP